MGDGRTKGSSSPYLVKGSDEALRMGINRLDRKRGMKDRIVSGLWMAIGIIPRVIDVSVIGRTDLRDIIRIGRSGIAGLGNMRGILAIVRGRNRKRNIWAQA